MFKDDRRLSNNDISSTSVLYNRWKLLNLSPDHSWVVCSEFSSLKFCSHSTQSLIITCNNLSFMNCIPPREIVYCVFRFMSPPQPSLSSTTARGFMCSSETRLNHLNFVSVYHRSYSYGCHSCIQIPTLGLLCIFWKPLTVDVAGQHITEREGGVT